MGQFANGRVFGPQWTNLLNFYNWQPADQNNQPAVPASAAYQDLYNPEEPLRSTYENLLALGSASNSPSSAESRLKLFAKNKDDSKKDSGALPKSRDNQIGRSSIGTAINLLMQMYGDELRRELRAAGKSEDEIEAFLESMQLNARLEITDADAKYVAALEKELAQENEDKVRLQVVSVVAEVIKDTINIDELHEAISQMGFTGTMPRDIGKICRIALTVIRHNTIDRDYLHNIFDEAYPILLKKFSNDQNLLAAERRELVLAINEKNLIPYSVESLQKAIDLIDRIMK